MTSFRITRGFPSDARSRAAQLYWEAFRGKLEDMTQPERKALDFLERVIDPEFPFSALNRSGDLLGLAGFKTSTGSLVGGDLSDLVQSYGWLGDSWRGTLFSFLERNVETGALVMDGICVATASRSPGVGGALLSAIREEAARLHSHSVRLAVIDINPRARAFYERQGFTAETEVSIGPLRHVFRFRRSTTMHCPIG